MIGPRGAGKSALTRSLMSCAAKREATKSPHIRNQMTTLAPRSRNTSSVPLESVATRLDYRDCVITVIDDTDQESIEDTRRILSAADTAVIVIGAAAGIDTETADLFEVCRMLQMPVITFINRWDCAGEPALTLIDEILGKTTLLPVPVNWPVGSAGTLRALIDLTAPDRVDDYQYGSAAGELSHATAALMYGQDWTGAAAEAALVAAQHRTYRRSEFLAGIATPALFGDGLRGISAPKLLDFVVDSWPALPRHNADGTPHPVNAPFSGQVFKVGPGSGREQGENIVHLRVCSGRFMRGSNVRHAQTGHVLRVDRAHQQVGLHRLPVADAWPGDIIEIYGSPTLRPGDTLYEATSTEFISAPSFAARAATRSLAEAHLSAS
ncbi:GTP-binding protein [Microbacterium profundi]|nr:GTP-binding protein [Microbacterium profundi]